MKTDVGKRERHFNPVQDIKNLKVFFFAVDRVSMTENRHLSLEG